MRRAFSILLAYVFVLSSCASGINQSNDLTIDAVRSDRPWIPSTTQLVRNTTFPDAGYKKLLSDRIDHPFVDDREVLGTWVAVDFVSQKEQFKPGTTFWKGAILDRTITFLQQGKTDRSWFEWTAGHFLHTGGNHTDSRYEIVDFDGVMYMFLEHKSGDYVFRFEKPSYYVYQKQSL